MAPRNVNPIGIWEYRNGDWVDLRTTRQSSGGMRANPSNIVTVPALDGMTMQRARDALSYFAGLVPEFVGGNPAPDNASQFTVQSQAPPPGTRVPEGTAVQVWLYGPYAPSSQASAASNTVPNLVGLTSAQANQSIVKAGLSAHIKTGPAAPVAAKNRTVQAQTPAPGQKLPPNGTVTLTIYSDYKRPATAGDVCRQNNIDFLGALIAKDYQSCRTILNRSKNCKFYQKGLADLHESECRSRAIQILKAKQKDDFANARAILAQSRDCDFYNRYAQELECSENLHAMSAAANAGNIPEYRSVLSRSSVLFNSGCIGTKGRRSVRLKKSFRSEITVEVSPNCDGGSNTQWEFMVHCPQ